MTYAQARKVLAAAGQEHVLAFWDRLDAKARKALLAQVASIDFEETARCRAVLAARGAAGVPSRKGAPRPPRVRWLTGAAGAAARKAGEAELRAGRVGVILVAGGQGSRLGFEGPKGCYPIGPVSGRSLFYFHARKILARSRRYGAPIPFYVMTSEANYADTVAHFEANGHFGLPKEDVFFFRQGMWPGMTDDGRIALEAPGKIFMSPDGHGGLLAALRKSGALADMKARGVTSLFFFQVDNPLVEVADPAFVGYHASRRADYSLKLCAKRDPFEKVGMPLVFGSRCEMVEYTEMTEEMCRRRDADGRLHFLYGSPAIHVFDRAFLEREAAKPMAIHLAHKKIPLVDGAGRTRKPSEPNGWKFEKFIFDALADARRPAFAAFDPADEFSPVKNADGGDSPATCRAALQAKWRRLLAAAGVTVADGVPLELDPAFALDAEDLAGGLLLAR